VNQQRGTQEGQGPSSTRSSSKHPEQPGSEAASAEWPRVNSSAGAREREACRTGIETGGGRTEPSLGGG